MFLINGNELLDQENIGLVVRTDDGKEWTARKLRRLADEQLDREWAERKARKAHTAPLTIGK